MLDDLRRALQSDYPPEYHRERLDRGVTTLWRWTLFIVTVLALGGLADAVGLID